MIYPVDLDTAHVLTFFESPSELWIGRLNPKYARLDRPRAKLRRAIGSVDISRQPSYFGCVSQFVYAFARLPPGVRFFQRCAHAAILPWLRMKVATASYGTSVTPRSFPR